MSSTLAIFGLGFVGDALARRAAADGIAVAGFSRRRAIGAGRVLDLGDPQAVQSLVDGAERYDCAVVTIAPQHVDPSLWSALARVAGRRLLLGSTGVYQRAFDCTQPIVTEETPLLDEHRRLAAERAFLETGGTVARLAGLFGGARNPVRWIRDGRVGYEKRQANLVHRDDVVKVLLRLSTPPAPQPVYNVADGQRHTWREIVDALVAAGVLEPQPPRLPRRNDAFVSPERLLADLGDFRFTDFWTLLERLCARA